MGKSLNFVESFYLHLEISSLLFRDFDDPDRKDPSLVAEIVSEDFTSPRLTDVSIR